MFVLLIAPADDIIVDMANLPSDYTNRMKEMLGDGYDAFIKCYDEESKKALRINRRLVSPNEYRSVAADATGCEDPLPVSIWDGAFYYKEDGPGRSPLHEAGAYYIQEPSAMLPVTMLDVNAGGQRVLDLCAAPGGKTTQIADLMDSKGLLVANEYVPGRAKILSENVERMGVRNALVISEDPNKLADRFPGFFDRILVDAPCSGEGMFRRNPEAVNEWSLENVKMCAKRQDMILDCAAAMLAPGGRIVYSTCTFSPEEDEGTLERFLSRHPEYTVAEGPSRLYPHTFAGEGHFSVALTRGSAGKEAIDISSQADTMAEPQNGLSFPQKDWSASLLDEVFHESSNATRGNERKRLLGKWLNRSRFSTGTVDLTDRIITFGDALYLAPEGMPDITGLKVYRAGIKLGSFKKDRFEPDHALSHALRPEDMINRVNLSPAGTAARQYLSGLTIECDKDIKGWCLVCVGDYPLGWGKASGGIIKNHYPKGLRKDCC